MENNGLDTPFEERVRQGWYNIDVEPKDRVAFYGLPKEVKFCNQCVMSNQRPTSAVEFKHTKESKKTTMNFDEEGVCDACRTAEIKENIDWDSREKELL